LKKILTDNGYYENNNYYFYVKNYLGNNVMICDRNGTTVQQTHYYPYGLTMSGSDNQGLQDYKFTGKELDMMNGLNLYDFEARTYDPAVGRFLSVDPMAEKYYHMSSYAYCANNPINAIDPDGRKIIFVNGYLGFGSPSGGAAYWGGANSAFVRGAQVFFHDTDSPVFTDIGHGKLSTSSWRRSKGYDYAKENYASLIDGMDKEKDKFRLVSHSMGGAFSDGIMKYLKEEGRNVDVAVYFNAWSPTSIEGSEGTILVDATVINDWVQALSHDNGNINIPNANYTVRKKSNASWDTVHRDLIDNGNVWKTDGSVNWNRAMSILQNWLQQNPNIKVTYQ
jgi:RHS repeat-associated protein